MSKNNNQKVVYIQDPYFGNDIFEKIINNKPRRTQIAGISIPAVLQAIQSYDYLIIYREGCGYSRRARDMLKNADVDYEEIDLEYISGTPDELREALANEKIGFPRTYSTVPMIFKKGKFIGGADQLPSHLK